MDEFSELLAGVNGNGTTSKAGTLVGPRRALGIAAWYSGVMHISTVLAGLPVHRYRSVGEQRERVATPVWMSRPDVEQPWYGLIEFFMMSFLHKGNAYAAKIRGGSDQVTGLREIHPDRVTAGVGPDGRKYFAIDKSEHLYTTREILHIPGLTYDGRFGMNPISTAADVLGSVAATDDYAARFFGNGTNLGGIISVQEAMTGDQARELRQEWDTFHQGILNAHRTGVLSKGARYDRVTLNAEDTQLIESRGYGVLEVARLLRLPPHKLYELTHATFTNIEHQGIEATTDCYQLWAERIEAFINYDADLTPLGTFHEFNLEGRLRGDTETRYAALTSAIGGPWMKPNEGRMLERLAPVDGGDVLLQPLNMGAVGDSADNSARDVAELSQKIYLAVANGVLTAAEARQVLIDAGANIPPKFPGVPA